ncbi:uncharacterized protein LOC143197718 [Rhynchophorus ferrugineus]|uniref:Uncharacterized protein n=1 Tax=Rhynchophorus ferrugineus TaxID=354439 RepID=A0A834M597_RHYFE|nr:hypothetical protein GWI33_018347 [Rhynchophorus ferrugineus]
MKILLFVVVLAFTDASPGYSGSSGNDINQGNSGGYGYSGSFSGTGVPNFAFPAFPPFDFSVFSNYIFNLNKYNQEFLNHIQKLAQGQAGAGYAPGFSGSSSGSNGAFAGGFGSGFAAPDIGNRGGFVGGYGGGFTGPDGQSFTFSGPIGGDGGAAFASGSIGPGGTSQSASVYPENPSAPNVNTRFGASSDGNGNGFKSVFTSSKSVTTNVDGKPQTFREASTTVNDNGKVTTYTAHNP